MGSGRRSELDSMGNLVPDMPYRCQDPTCGCYLPREGVTHFLRFTTTPEGFRADVLNEYGWAVDEFRDHSLSNLVDSVHRNYPHARKVSRP